MTRCLLPALLGCLLPATALLAAADDEFNDELRKELVAMLKEDQDLRNQLIKQRTIDQPTLRKLQDQERKHLARLKEVVNKYGFPSPRLIGEDGVQAMFGLVQHADKDRAFQNKVLETMKAQAKKGELSQQYVAGMTDYLRILDKKKQLYGTQFKIEKNGDLTPYPIEDEKNVNQRRTEIGLPTLEDHLKMLKQQFKPK